MTRANTYHAIFIFNNFRDLTMSNDIKKQKKIDYIPEDHILCERCKYYAICPMDYICKSVDRSLEDEREL